MNQELVNSAKEIKGKKIWRIFKDGKLTINPCITKLLNY